ncbi:2-C-methyl-D-erythritol 4-phosphate cytidylyltransferase [Paenibacillus sp. J2TS4]|uniref:2-C-methyl-D-erythritol 4-phosphate cytidylyltransferase n=1 Tax=Paenibacillus sp. J2TS4 TaxID=2807194 RepID=UPI001B00DA49|nr:2-C-methyl-D-erythritol 4-phosphate cytidylyltransferase [Paenibacillus sp. J2TS4]GIP36233.1 2-C-methyl-D-erythritol 4-phosphate cytidylyltransferase [Paenibacillus sp. J2TS4]
MGKQGVIVVAGGTGSRMGTTESKQYLMLGDKPILIHTLLTFQQVEEIDSIVLVVGQGDEDRCHAYMDRYGLAKVVRIVTGGTERQHSVHRGLRHLPDEIEWVLVHDAVRPFVSRQDILRCLAKAKQTGAAVLAVPVKDTIKKIGAEGAIESTPDRRSLWAIQTPQAFRLSALAQAYEKAEADGFVGTDDAMLVERMGQTVYVVEGSYANIKITTPEDLGWAEWYVQSGRGEIEL